MLLRRLHYIQTEKKNDFKMLQEELKRELEELEKQIRGCKKCGLCETRTNAVPGEGSSEVDIMLVGEAPGFNEDKQGNPFVGAAGGILDQLLKSVDISKDDVYITNILKCRPPGNRNPQEDEINSCAFYLDRQIELIKPKVICCLGNFAIKFIMKKFNLDKEIQGVSKIHGKVLKVSTLDGQIKIVAMYHPAVAAYDMNMFNILKEDFKKIK